MQAFVSTIKASLIREDRLRMEGLREGLPTPVFWPREFRGLYIVREAANLHTVNLQCYFSFIYVCMHIHFQILSHYRLLQETE